MKARDLETAVLRALDGAAGLAGRPVDPDRPLAEQFAFDETRFHVALARETGMEIPPGHRDRLATLGGCLDYLEERLAG